MTPEQDANEMRGRSGQDVAGPIGGERLADARRARGVSVRDIAKELHLDEPKVRALEENRFEVLGAPVFAKGHMRKYAELVGVPIDDVLADYHRLNRATGAPPVVGPPRRTRRDFSIGSWVAGIVVIAVLGAAAWWWLGVGSAPPGVRTPAAIEPESLRGAATSPAPEPSDDSAAAAEQEEALQQADVLATEAAAEAEPAAVPEEERADVVTGAVGHHVELRLDFSGDCWAEVTDATGQRLFFDLGTDGRSVTLSGVGPLRVLLGNFENVAVSVDGAEYAIPAANRRDNTAMLTIYGQ